MFFPHRHCNPYYVNIRFTTKFIVENIFFTCTFLYLITFVLSSFQFLCTRQTLLVNMSQIQTIKTSALIIIQLLLEILLDGVYRVTVYVILKFHSN